MLKKGQEAVVQTVTPFRACLGNAVRSVYFWACLLYLAYTAQLLAIDYCSDMYSEDDQMCKAFGFNSINKQFVATAVVHLVTAVLYLAAWWGFLGSYSPWVQAGVLAPEVFNIVEACIYMKTASIYGSTSVDCAVYPNGNDDYYLEDYFCSQYTYLHELETAAAVISLAASFGWVWSWWVSYLRTKGRGLTWQDPDAYATALNVTASVMYVVYNAQILEDRPSYATNKLYIKADVVFCVSAIFYFFGSLRDCGFLSIIPLPGCLSYDAASILPGPSTGTVGLPLELEHSSSHDVAQAAVDPKHDAV